MATRTKITPFARLLLVLIIIIPSAFIGASYINGEDPIAKIKEVAGMETSSKTETPSRTSKDDPRATIKALRSENAALKEKISTLESELETLRKTTTANREKWGN